MSYRDLEEGYYPFDLKNLSLLTIEVLPQWANLNELLQPEPEGLGIIASLHYHPRWKLLLLGYNSD